MKRTKFTNAKQQREQEAKDAKDYMQIVRRIAWNFHATTGIAFEDLFGEALVSFYSAKESYKPNRGTKFTTWAYMVTQHKMIDFCKKWKLRTAYNIEDLKEEPSITDVSPFILLEFIGMRKDALYVAKMILENPVRFDVKTSKALITEELLKRGWKYQRIWDVLKELKKQINR